ncbi:KIR protein [Plasmodium coatneyi]|uniref:KIR protein n=1 Tax=Plasmodium coatneyi TaxID=208452 RepID=A0A1B1DWT4_9APIC|nr:KIR protein [Plasmodium coatneyi]ANQ07045.1 KIR protein [Plasmodium coatneyi]
MSTIPPLQRLPSRVDYYEKFDAPVKIECRCRDIWPEQWGKVLQNKLGKNPELAGTDEMVLDAYCCAHKLKNEKPDSSGDPCLFFYYWMEHRFHSHDDRTKLKNFMGEIYETLKKIPYNHKCKVMYKSNINWYLLGYIKEIYDFCYNYNTIQRHAEQYRGTYGQTYLTYLRKIGTACINAGAHCKSPENKDDPYCKWFNEEKEEKYCNRQKLLELENGAPYPPKHKPNPDQNQDCNLENLNSKLMYNELDEGIDYSVDGTPACKWDTDGTTLKTSLENELRDYVNIKKDADKIAKGWCYLINRKDENKINGPTYYLFYYWLGSKVWKSAKDRNSFKEIMNNIYLQLGNKLNGIERGLTYTNIGENEFQKLKEIFDCSYDYSTIEDYVRGDSGAPKSQCIEKYYCHLEQALSAYTYMNAKCPRKDNKDDWCKEFQRILSDRSYRELSELKSKLELLRKPVVDKSHQLNTTEATSSGSAVAGVSSTLTLLGLPAAAFFLYKYNLLPSWVSNYFGNNNSRNGRKRRSIGRNSGTRIENFTDYSSENNSTIGPTEYSTENSTVESIDAPTIYRRPHRGRRTNNRRGHQNIGYQNM